MVFVIFVGRVKRKMSEKVLGFKEKDALYDDGMDLVQGWAIDEDKLVPVVSLEWLEKWCRKYQKKLDYDIEFDRGQGASLIDLLADVRLQAGKK